jgi:hypothetical protein
MNSHALASLTLVLVGCHAQERAPASTAAVVQHQTSVPSVSDTSSVGTTQDSARARYWAFVAALDRPRDSLPDSIGQPLGVVFTQTPNIHEDSVTDSSITVRFSRYTIYYYRTRGLELLTGIQVTEPRSDLPFGIGVGSKEAAVLRYFGHPNDSRTGSESTILTFDVPGEDAALNQLQFTLQAGVVKRVAWAFYVD